MSTKLDAGDPVDGRDYTYPSGPDELRKNQRPMTREAAELCVMYLAETAEAHAAWAARRKFLEKHLAVVLAIESGKIGTSTPKGDRDNKARISVKYQKCLRELEESIYHETLLTSLRHAADKKFSGWQSLNANLRQGLQQ